MHIGAAGDFSQARQKDLSCRCVEISQASRMRRLNGFEVIPPQPCINSKLRVHAPDVLHIEARSCLTFARELSKDRAIKF